ncbi:amidohydrolase [Algoriphagus namhaensis]|uniref:Amidohydrolase n=1 Tax=Algoriphagus namhaensis TaxID=915353 RepID=A0ABV8AWP0_9BACT
MIDSELIEIRRFLHSNPELSGREFETQRFLKNELESIDCHDIKSVGDTGLAVFFKSKNPGKRILIRADIDALPITEINTFDHKSNMPGISHKCGHDGHATILLGLARKLSQSPISSGEVCLLFQPAEETGQGASQVLHDPNFDFKPDFAFALHNLPGFPLHQVICRPSSFTAAVKSVIFKFSGKTSHAAEPENGINPGLAVAEVIQAVEKISQKDISRKDFALASLIHVHLGEKAYGVSAGYAEVHFTLRSWSNEVMENFDQNLLTEVQSITKNHKLDLEHEYLEEFHANTNDPKAFALVKEAAAGQELDFKEIENPFRFGEDFGLFTEKFPGAMFGIGGGENCPALHNPDYDFPDELIETGIRMFDQLVKLVLDKSQ